MLLIAGGVLEGTFLAGDCGGPTNPGSRPILDRSAGSPSSCYVGARSDRRPPCVSGAQVHSLPSSPLCAAALPSLIVAERGPSFLRAAERSANGDVFSTPVGELGGVFLAPSSSRVGFGTIGCGFRPLLCFWHRILTPSERRRWAALDSSPSRRSPRVSASADGRMPSGVSQDLRSHPGLAAVTSRARRFLIRFLIFAWNLHGSSSFPSRLRIASQRWKSHRPGIFPSDLCVVLSGFKPNPATVARRAPGRVG